MILTYAGRAFQVLAIDSQVTSTFLTSIYHLSVTVGAF